MTRTDRSSDRCINLYVRCILSRRFWACGKAEMAWRVTPLRG